jgi:hypothetical protein
MNFQKSQSWPPGYELLSKNHIVDDGRIEDMEVMQLSMKTQMIASRYAKVKAYDNHYRDTTDSETTTMATYDFEVTSIFE